MPDQPTIVIRPEAFGAGYDVTVEPAPSWTSFDAERPTIKAARRYAESLRTVHGWKVVDRSGEPA